MANITPLDKGSVHRICSGQVVLSLGIGVKELVENALDAGAKRVEVGFYESGWDKITVSDDGHGVEPQNYTGLALKHHTSKIRNFSDVAEVDTFGFRGEALSSLCALSKLTVITRTPDSKIGVELSYDNSGKLVSTKNISHELNLKKHVKREFTKMLNVLTSYALISTGLSLYCWNMVKGKRTTVLQTHGRSEIKETLKDVFGSKSIKSLEEVNGEEGMIKINGYISSVKHGEGRNASDRQFLYLNHRPADLNKIRRRLKRFLTNSDSDEPTKKQKIMNSFFSESVASNQEDVCLEVLHEKDQFEDKRSRLFNGIYDNEEEKSVKIVHQNDLSEDRRTRPFNEISDNEDEFFIKSNHKDQSSNSRVLSFFKKHNLDETEEEDFIQNVEDEKYNFETLQNTCRLEPQNMVIPQVLELTYANENILSENIDIFNENGFEFDFNEEANVGSHYKLKRVPMYRNWNFGKSDVEELIFMLTDFDRSCAKKLRPSKVRAMFASRSCRSSVMIGTALSYRDMRRLIDHMSEMEHPWNCPHGRPTMRHLVNLNMIRNLLFNQ
ncbi:PMS2 [Lepeophtheirus salmonis]|uniref:PMS2 n=1 Tax=Lepeophtheirus salmonis TaxID=72036 RepID=A0A7R8CYP7_LEPSM|nr:PMS2 [Lepeophtheirus salmonis]CAF2970662.1 PMS2 [Lepeophtheirus salmonis]